MKKNLTKEIKAQLRSYQQLAEGVPSPMRSRSITLDFKATLMAALPAAALGIGIPQQASAAVMTRVVNSTLTGTGAFPFDIDNGGQDDLALNIQGGGMGVGADFGQTIFVLETSPAATAWFSKLDYGQAVPTGGDFRMLNNAAYNGISFTSYTTSPWNGVAGVGFLGVRFELDPVNNPGVFHLGWLALDVNDHTEAGARSIKILRAGWETDPNATSIAIPTVLPVEFINFQAQLNIDGYPQLHWKTATETNNAGFEVQRSTDEGRHFRTIAWVDGQGNTNNTQQYQFADKEAISGDTYYYRLKQVDFDGQFDYSPTISLAIGTSKASISDFFPHPASSGNSISITINSPKNAQWTAQIFDLQGQLIKEEHQTLSAGRNEWLLQLTDLVAGTYFVKFSDGEQPYYQQLIVQ